MLVFFVQVVYIDLSGVSRWGVSRDLGSGFSLLKEMHGRASWILNQSDYFLK